MATGIILREQDEKSGRGDRGLAMEGREKILSGKHEEIKNSGRQEKDCVEGVSIVWVEFLHVALGDQAIWNVELLAQVWCHHCIKVHSHSSRRCECDTPCGDRQTGADQTEQCVMPRAQRNWQFQRGVRGADWCCGRGRDNETGG